jgi:IclR family acetate operon transcriptional repressor
MSRRSTTSDPRGARSVERTVDLLECLAMDGPELSLAELARATGLPKSTAHRIAETLVRRGLVARGERTQRYRVGMLAATLGDRALVGLGLDAVVPQLYAVAARVGLTVTVALGPPDALVAVIVAEPPRDKGSGARDAPHARTRNQVRDLALRLAASMATHQRGPARERVDGAAAVAVAVRDSHRGALGAVAAHGRAEQLDDDRVVHVLPVLQQIAAAVARASSDRRATV